MNTHQKLAAILKFCFVNFIVIAFPLENFIDVLGYTVSFIIYLWFESLTFASASSAIEEDTCNEENVPKQESKMTSTTDLLGFDEIPKAKTTSMLLPDIKKDDPAFEKKLQESMTKKFEQMGLLHAPESPVDRDGKLETTTISFL